MAKAEIEVPDSAFVMDMVFSDGGHQYDNNNRADFHAAVEGAEETLENNRGSAPPSFTTSSSRTA